MPSSALTACSGDLGCPRTPGTHTLQPGRLRRRCSRPSVTLAVRPRSLAHHGRPLRAPRSGGVSRGPPSARQAPGRPLEHTAAPLPLSRAPAHPGLHSGRGRAGHQLPGACPKPQVLPGQPPPLPPPPCVPLACNVPGPAPPSNRCRHHPHQPDKPRSVVPVPMTVPLLRGRVLRCAARSFAALFAGAGPARPPTAPTHPRPLKSCCCCCSYRAAGWRLAPHQQLPPALLTPRSPPPAMCRWRRPTLRTRCSSAPRCATCCAPAPAPLWCAAAVESWLGLGLLDEHGSGQAAPALDMGGVLPCAPPQPPVLTPSDHPCPPARCPRCTTTLGAAL